MNELSPEKLFEGRKKALQNAIELFEDADILFNAGRWARSFFLVQIATEELGKYGIITTSSISALHGSLDWNRFWKRLRSHRDKTEHLLLLENINHLLHKQEKELVKIEKNEIYSSLQEEAKMKSLYCDHYDKEEFSVPSEIVNKNVCEISLNLLKNRIDLVKSFEEQIASKIELEKIRKEDVEFFYDKIGISEFLQKDE